MFGDERHALIVVADGAGGMTGASRASDRVIEVMAEVTRYLDTPIGPVGLAAVLRRLDHLVLACPTAGQTTAVIVEVVEDRLWGASVGDSGAWLVHGGRRIDLTAAQRRKWRLGTGLADPRWFGPLPLIGTLLVGTDGVFECATPERLARAVGPAPLACVADAVLQTVKTPRGALQDDVAMVLCRSAADERAAVRSADWARAS